MDQRTMSSRLVPALMLCVSPLGMMCDGSPPWLGWLGCGATVPCVLDTFDCRRVRLPYAMCEEEEEGHQREGKLGRAV